jgi:hypothetical protein
MKNIYNLINKQQFDPNILFNKEFMLMPHQLLPKYYLLGSDTNFLILHYSMGSGKTLSALYILLYRISFIAMNDFNRKFLLHDNAKSNRVVIVGAWQTKMQFENELLRPELNNKIENKIKEINELLKSPIDENRKKGEDMKIKMVSKLSKNILFLGYQAFFNNVFPNISSAAYNQDNLALEKEYDEGNLKINEEFLELLRDNFICIDEMQRLYSINGLNSYGFAVKCLARKAKEYNIKMIFLTGTMINNNIKEVVDICDIFSPKNLDRNKYLETFTLVDDDGTNIPMWKIKYEEELLNIFKNILLYFNMEPNKSQGKRISAKTLPARLNINKSLDVLILPRDNLNLPLEMHVGNYFLNPLVLDILPTYGEQDKFAKNATTSDEDNENDRIISIHDAYIPPTTKWSQLGIYQSGSIIMGKILQLDVLKNYSTIGYHLVKLCISHALNNEKTIVYHNKINSFGIKQYAQILAANGLIKFGQSPNSISICRECGFSQKLHFLSLEERLEKKICSQFKGIYYDMLIGELDQNERDVLTNVNYNSPKNLYGDIISVMLVSDIAYFGVSFYNTNNIILLSRINNISKWRQIYTRIIRMNSHIMLPINRQFAKVYTFAIESDKLYYKMRVMYNKGIVNFMNKIRDVSIMDKLLENPNRLHHNELLYSIFNEDVTNQIISLINRVFRTTPMKIWSYNTFIKRIKDSKKSLIFLNISAMNDIDLINILLNTKLIRIFNYGDDNDNYITLMNQINVSQTKKFPSFSFTQLDNLDIKTNALQELVLSLEKLNMQKKIKTIAQIVYLIGNKYNLLTEKQLFWDAVYDIGDEFYDDDENNFFHNHTERNRSKVVGMYYGNIIIYRDGRYTSLNYHFPNISGLESLPYVFKITCLAITENSSFNIHLVILNKSVEEITDNRKRSKGIICTSFDKNKLTRYYPIEKSDNNTAFCINMMLRIIKEQDKNETRFVYSPFEK